MVAVYLSGTGEEIKDSKEVLETCPVCNEPKEAMRHFTAECMYKMSEVVPKMKDKLFFEEVDLNGAYFGITRIYHQGKRDNYTSRTRDDGVIELANNEKPIGTIRLYETNGYTIRCCKDCRADLLTVLQRWSNGEFRHEDTEEGNIPIRVNGATRMITEQEYFRMKGLKR